MLREKQRNKVTVKNMRDIMKVSFHSFAVFGSRDLKKQEFKEG